MKHVRSWRIAALLAALFLGRAPGAQVNVTGGVQTFTWTADAATAQTMVNQTQLPIAGLWVRVNTATQLETIAVPSVGAPIWFVDDDENAILAGAENDTTDGSPGPAGGWHRAHAFDNTGLVFFGGSFGVILRGVGGVSLAGQSVSIVPLARNPAQTGGNLGRRIQPPLDLTEALSSKNVVIDPVNAPPFSSEFAVAMANGDAAKSVQKVEITPPGGVTVINASASGGGVYTAPPDTITWPAPVPVGESRQIDVTLSGLVRPLITTIGFSATFVQTSAVPALPVWALGLLVSSLLVGALALGRRGTP